MSGSPFGRCFCPHVVFLQASRPHLLQPGRPLQGALAATGRLYRGLAAAGCPCRWPSRGRPPLQADNMQVAAPQTVGSATIAAHRCNKCVEQGREENKRRWPKLQPINYEPPSYL
ncbi:hypothetical protein GW17_00022364 [Ensete ventricosum]|nr:hypothetical protein GW17_00022364 [Ensete ventricosum]RZS19707.1 hypothetical protein BHM03_00052138 [Ensete ventricosum]